MTRPVATLTVAFFLVALLLSVYGQEKSGLEVISGYWTYNQNSDFVRVTNDVVLKWRGTVMSAEGVTVNTESGQATAVGHVRIQRDDQVWTGERIEYNFKTHLMTAARFRTGRAPVFAQGEGLHGIITNSVQNASGTNVYTATNAFVTLDDVSNPLIKVRANRIRIVPGQYIEATHAVLYVGEVPVFYFPYYKRNLGPHANNLNLVPGYRSAFGPFLLSDYTWYLNEELDGAVHLDYRQKRGVGTGPDLNFHLGRWGEGAFRYYYSRDEDAGTNLAGVANRENRQLVDFSYQANPFTNLNVKSLVRYQNDSDFVKDFYQGDYRRDPQPDTFVEANRFWSNFSLDVLAQPRINDFWETVERLPDVRLTGFPQQIGPTPLYYESQTSVGYYRRLFAGSNSPFPSSTVTLFGPLNRIPPNFSAERADTYQQVALPVTLFGWLNIKPRIGGRLTYYSPVEVAGGGTTFRTNSDTYRAVLDTGAEVSFKASRLWPAVQNRTLELDGLRHILEPSLNYVFVPQPNYLPNQLPQFDYELPSLSMLPIEFPQYNSIDSIDSENVIRFGLRNRLQTKRAGQVEDFLDWQLFADWRLRPRDDQRTFSDLYSDLILRPRSWITVQSLTRLDLNSGQWRLALHTVSFQPNDTWSWSIGHFYLRDDLSSSPTALGQGNDSITSSLFYRLNENWGFRASQYFDARDGRLQEQYYTIYRDMRSWTAAVTAGVLDNGFGPKDFTIAFTFSIKARPKFGVGSDTVRPYALLGLQ
jgi:LPS-assembly protein